MILKREDITQELLKEYLSYDPITGYLTWIKKLGRKVVVGDRAGCLVNGRDSRTIKIFGIVFLEHRLIWLYLYGYYPSKSEHIDHINHIEDDNSQRNLRLVSQAENNRNSSLRSDNALGRTGIWITKLNKYKKYVAEIRDEKGKKHSKAFYTLQEAIAQREAWEVQFGYHPNHGIIKPI